jgi:hypothetical protein
MGPIPGSFWSLYPSVAYGNAGKSRMANAELRMGDGFCREPRNALAVVFGFPLAPESISLAPESILGPSVWRIPILILTGCGTDSARATRPCFAASASQGRPGMDSGPGGGLEAGPTLS